MKDAIRELLPPDEGGKPLSPLTRWRIAVFGTCVGFLFFIAWALSPFGFARASDQNALRDNVDDLRLSQIEQQVHDLKQTECVSTDKLAKRFFSNRIMELVRKYRQLSGLTVDVPPCPTGQEPQ